MSVVGLSAYLTEEIGGAPPRACMANASIRTVVRRVLQLTDQPVHPGGRPAGPGSIDIDVADDLPGPQIGRYVEARPRPESGCCRSGAGLRRVD